MRLALVQLGLEDTVVAPIRFESRLLDEQPVLDQVFGSALDRRQCRIALLAQFSGGHGLSAGGFQDRADVLVSEENQQILGIILPSHRLHFSTPLLKSRRFVDSAKQGPDIQVAALNWRVNGGVVCPNDSRIRR